MESFGLEGQSVGRWRWVSGEWRRVGVRGGGSRFVRGGGLVGWF